VSADGHIHCEGPPAATRNDRAGRYVVIGSGRTVFSDNVIDDSNFKAN
jgi:hypothetical protein